MSALMLAATITAALGIWGPLDIAKLERWQTLLAAIIAPLIALIAAIVAYKAAMAKVELDRENVERERTNAKLSLYLRLRTQLVRIAGECRQASDMIKDLQGIEDTKNVWAWYPRPFEDATEIVEAWNSLFLFPAEAYSELERVRDNFPRVNRLLSDALRQMEQKQTIDDARSSYSIYELQEVAACANRLLAILDARLRQLPTYS